MGKKIATEIKFDNFIFNGKVGTLNKANPESIYIELGTFITPLYEEDTYEETMKVIERGFRKAIRDNLITSKLFDSDYICVFEIASDRMKIGKKSFLSIQCHFKPKDVKKLNEIYNETLIQPIENLSNALACLLEDNSMEYSKTKKAA